MRICSRFSNLIMRFKTTVCKRMQRSAVQQKALGFHTLSNIRAFSQTLARARYMVCRRIPAEPLGDVRKQHILRIYNIKHHLCITIFKILSLMS